MVLGHNHFQQDLHDQQHFLVEEQSQGSTDTSQNLSNAGVARRKFAKPPVKVACLACRASRTRCDGQEPCSSCANKARECSYLPSKRGGPRKKKSSVTHSDHEELAQTSPWDSNIIPDSQFQESEGSLNLSERSSNPIDVPIPPVNPYAPIESMSIPAVVPRHLDFDPGAQVVYGAIFAQSGKTDHTASSMPQMPLSSGIKQPSVRAYGSELEILNAYYEFIHPYFPILPPSVAPPGPDLPLENVGSNTNSPSAEASLPYQPASPLSCAISAVLALVSLRGIPESASVLMRRLYSHSYARLAMVMVEADGELIDSVTDPSQALNYAQPTINREPFHPQVPLELESILALLVLSNYEYAERGNISKMRYRAGQAWVLATNLDLNTLGAEQDEFTEARRRAWWMSYFCVLQGSITSVTPPPIMINDPRVTTPYPQFASDPEGWSIFLQVQQLLVAMNQFLVDLDKCLKSRSNMPLIYDHMKQLDAWTTSLMTQATTPSSARHTGDMRMVPESDVAESIRAISRMSLASAQIKLHQFRAFSDLPGFIKKHFGLASPVSEMMEPFHGTSRGQQNSLECQCHQQFDAMGHVLSTQYSGGQTSDSTATTASGPIHRQQQQPPQHYCWLGPGFPFSAQQSSDISLQAAFLISHMLGSLPYPLTGRTSGRQESTPRQHFPDPTMLDPRTQMPRTMPYYASCALQGSYALLMTVYKTRIAKDRNPSVLYDEGHHSSTDQMLDGLSHGLERILGAVSNFSRASEALSGMSDSIERATHAAFSQQ